MKRTFSFRTEGYYDTDHGPGFLGHVEKRNTWKELDEFWSNEITFKVYRTKYQVYLYDYVDEVSIFLRTFDSKNKAYHYTLRQCLLYEQELDNAPPEKLEGYDVHIPWEERCEIIPDSISYKFMIIVSANFLRIFPIIIHGDQWEIFRDDKDLMKAINKLDKKFNQDRINKEKDLQNRLDFILSI